MDRSDSTREVLPGGYWLTPVLFDDLMPARPGAGHSYWEVPSNEPPEFPLNAPGESQPEVPQEEPPRTPLEMPRPQRGQWARAR